MSNGREISFRIPARKRVFKEVYQFRISLAVITPQIWRRIQVPISYTFYDLHVAIQDAMGWEDRHLHVFEIGTSETIRIECPFAEPEFGEHIQYWTTEIALKKHFKRVGSSVAYRYDFGDNWLHSIELEGILPVQANMLYPRCIDGARACPPEDCGGPGGYERYLKVLKRADPSDESFIWLGNWKPERFDKSGIKFEEPKTRFLRSFED